MSKDPIVSIIMGSDSDLKIMQDAFDVFKEFEVPFEVKILSAHRTPDEHVQFSKSALERGIKVIIAAAGGAAHLPGVTAAQTILPVIGVPISSNLKGVDSLLSIVQMPGGVPVATVAIDASKNAAILAVQILATGDPGYRKLLVNYKQKIAEQSLQKNDNLLY